MLSILRGFTAFISGSGLIFLNVKVDQILSLNSIQSFITWVIITLTSMVALGYTYRQFVKAGLEIREKRNKLNKIKRPRKKFRLW